MNKNARQFVRNYIMHNRHNLFLIEKRSRSPFVIADSVFNRYALPSQLKYLSVIESELKSKALSHVGAVGPWQLMPATAERFGVVHPFYIHENVRGGVAYLAELQQLFHGDLRLVMAAYAAGERQIRPRGLSYSSQEVYAYVQRIAQQYRAELRRSGGN